MPKVAPILMFTSSIILTTHYIEEAEELADRIGVITHGELILVERKTELMHKLGKKQLTLQLQQPLSQVPPELVSRSLTLSSDGSELIYTYDTQDSDVGVAELLKELADVGIHYKDLRTEQSSLEDIFVSLVTERNRKPS